MAAGQPFSLFPRGVPKLITPTPHKRNPSLHTVKTLHGDEGDAGDVPLPNGGGIPLQTRVSRSRTPSPENIGVAVTTASPIDGATPSPRHKPAGYSTPPPPPPPPPPPAKAHSPGERSSGRSGSATLISEGTKSPVVPIRSMFPTYNPSIPLAQQNYYPQRYAARASSIYPASFSREEYRNSITTPIDRQLGHRTATPSVVNFHDAMSIAEAPQFSSHRELEKLWEASHGTEPSSLIKTFDLEMTR